MDDESTFDDLGAIPESDQVINEVENVSLTPEQHQQIKNIVHGDEFRAFLTHHRTYLVCGAGDESTAATRRKKVYDLLSDRNQADATKLEDWGLTKDEIELWVHLFDKLCAHCTHIVAVIEDFDGGYVWELGLLFAPPYRDAVWVLKRRYPDCDTERSRYENGMAASHVRTLLTGKRAFEWTNMSKLEAAVSEIP